MKSASVPAHGTMKIKQFYYIGFAIIQQKMTLYFRHLHMYSISSVCIKLLFGPYKNYSRKLYYQKKFSTSRQISCQGQLWIFTFSETKPCNTQQLISVMVTKCHTPPLICPKDGESSWGIKPLNKRYLRLYTINGKSPVFFGIILVCNNGS